MGFWLLAFAYLPTRLIQQANPEWRLVSWALAVEVIGLTALLVRGQKTEDREERTAAETPKHGFLLSTINYRLSTLPLVRGQKTEDREQRTATETPKHGFLPSTINHRLSTLPLFPLFFFFVAVPWPTVIEGPFIQGLTRANAAAAVELLSAIGVPAIQHGNLIEVGTGVIGIDEACSGIRSFQATLMISLFFGELYRLRALHRACLCLLGFVLSFVFNVARTTLLTWIAASKGTAALSNWHDPAGVMILLACFACLWLLSLALRRDHRTIDHRPWTIDHEAKAKVPALSAETASTNPAGASSRPRFRVYGLWSMVYGPSSFSLLAWLLFSDVATELWYRAHERHLPPPVTWTVQFPRNNPSFRELPLAERTRQFLRFDEGANGCWQIEQRTEDRGQRTAPKGFGVQDGQTQKPEDREQRTAPKGFGVQDSQTQKTEDRGQPRMHSGWRTEGGWDGPTNRKVQAIFLRWKPGRTAVHLAKTHTPEACVTAGGRELVSKSEVRLFKAGGLELPFRSYVFKDVDGPLHVYYCLWEDRGRQQGFDSSRLTYGNRLEPVLAGRRLAGQRSLELAIWGCADEEEADAVARRELGEIINSRDQRTEDRGQRTEDRERTER